VRAPRAVFFGYHTIGCRGLEALLEAGADVRAVFTHADDPAEPRWFESVADLARRRGIPVHLPPSPNTPQALGILAALEPDLFLSVHYRRLLGAEALGVPRLAALNLHASLLPRYRGRAPLNWAIARGERETGVTLHHMAREADAGDIVAQRPVPIGPDDTALVVYERMLGAAGALLADTLPLVLAGTAPRRPQDHAAATWFGKRRPEDGAFDWSWPARRIHDLVRAVTHPWPGAFAPWRGGRLFVWATGRGEPDGASEAPGTIVKLTEAGPVVQTGAGHLLLRSLQPEGEGERAGARFVEERHLRAGDSLCR
jgi:UDP-4-amino-4-deoxy-L-arabinose formyltransferase/UDP-glucuronic acid dehydrogenase (UDP-4-keto-hexauronic acid decarboxylating)